MRLPSRWMSGTTSRSSSGEQARRKHCDGEVEEEKRRGLREAERGDEKIGEGEETKDMKRKQYWKMEKRKKGEERREEIEEGREPMGKWENGWGMLVCDLN